MKAPIYQHIALLLASALAEKPYSSACREKLEKICKDFLPSGSGFDSGTELDPSSTPEKLIFNTSFHHMNDVGYYCGWTKHTVKVTPSLQFGIHVYVSGRDYRNIKSYIEEAFQANLTWEENL